MIRVKNKSFIFSIILLFMMLLIPEISIGQELTFEQALNRGLQTAGELRDVRENINSLQRKITSLKARQDWQVELGAQYNHTFSEVDNGLVEGRGSYSTGGSSLHQNSVNLGISRSFSSGLTITPEFILKEESGTDFSVDVNYPLLPLSPPETDRQIYRTEKELLRAESSLLQKKAELLLSWLEKYLSLIRIIEKEKIYASNLIKAEENLEEVLERQQLGEAGKQELLTARLGVKEAEYGLVETKKQIEEVKTALRQSLNLKEGQKLIIKKAPDWYQALTEKAEELITKYLTETEEIKLISITAAHNYDLKVNRIERELLQQELAWLHQDGNTDINVIGSYNSTDDDFTVGINVSHQLYDSGQRHLEYADKEAEIAAVEEDYQEIYQDMESQIKHYQNKIKLSKMRLEKEKLALEKSEFEVEVFQKQLDRGLLDYLQYQEKWLNSRETEINFSSLKDQLLLDRLRLIAFINIQEIAGGLFND